MNESMTELRAVLFMLDGDAGEPQTRTQQELGRACAHLAACGIDAEWEVCGKTAETGENAEDEVCAGQVPQKDALILTDSEWILREMTDAGFAAAGYLHDDVQNVPGASYLIAEADEISPEDYEKIYDRLTGRPWTILVTERVIVRETTAEDADRLYECYDAQALRFLTPLPDKETQLRNMASYREKVYGFYGFGEWSLIDKESGAFIGLMGFEPFAQGEEAVHFGFLLHPDWRGKGIACECGRALLAYGERCLGFSVIRAEASPENKDSVGLLQKLGFALVGTGEDNGKIEEIYEYRTAAKMPRY